MFDVMAMKVISRAEGNSQIKKSLNGPNGPYGMDWTIGEVSLEACLTNL